VTGTEPWQRGLAGYLCGIIGQYRLTVESYLDTASYPTGVKVSDEELAALCIERDPFHPEWNYTIRPQVA
jgi:hypothetical protein